MSQQNLTMNSPTVSNDPPVKRKRGRPRKDESTQAHSSDKAQLLPNKPIIITRLQSERLQASPAISLSQTTAVQAQPQSYRNAPTGNGKGKERASEDTNSNNNDSSDDEMVGKVVKGVIEGSFNDGYFLSVKVGDTEDAPHLRGVVFLPGKVVPVTAETDVAPLAKMYNREEIPIPDMTIMQQQTMLPPPPSGSSPKSAEVIEKEKTISEESGSSDVIRNGDGLAVAAEKISTDTGYQNASEKMEAVDTDVLPTEKISTESTRQQSASDKVDIHTDNQDGESKELESLAVKELVDVVVPAKDLVELPAAAEQTLKFSDSQLDSIMSRYVEPLQKGESDTVALQDNDITERETAVISTEKAVGTKMMTETIQVEAFDKEMMSEQPSEVTQKTDEDHIAKGDVEDESLTTPSQRKILDETQDTEPPSKILKTIGVSKTLPVNNAQLLQSATDAKAKSGPDNTSNAETMSEPEPMMIDHESAGTHLEARLSSGSGPDMPEQSNPSDIVGTEHNVQERFEQETTTAIVTSSMDIVGTEIAIEQGSKVKPMSGQ